MRQSYQDDNLDALERIFQGPINWMNLLMIGLNVIIYLVAIKIRNSESAVDLIHYGASYVPAILDGEWYRLVTSMFLHYDLEHLINNMLLLLFIGDWIEDLAGKWKYLLIYIGGGFAGNILSFLWDIRTAEYYYSVGASGAVYAVIGAFLVVLLKNKGRMQGVTASRVGVVLLLTIHHGLQSVGIDNAAHIGGAVGGMLLALIFCKKSICDNLIESTYN